MTTTAWTALSDCFLTFPARNLPRLAVGRLSCNQPHESLSNTGRDVHRPVVFSRQCSSKVSESSCLGASDAHTLSATCSSKTALDLKCYQLHANAGILLQALCRENRACACVSAQRCKAMWTPAAMFGELFRLHRRPCKVTLMQSHAGCILPAW